MDVIKARVTGSRPIRDAITREAVQPGDEVRLYVRPIGGEIPPCPRHPKKRPQRNSEPCYCHTTVIEPLVESGAIELIEDKAPKGAKATA